MPYSYDTVQLVYEPDREEKERKHFSPQHTRTITIKPTESRTYFIFTLLSAQKILLIPFCIGGSKHIHSVNVSSMSQYGSRDFRCSIFETQQPNKLPFLKKKRKGNGNSTNGKTLIQTYTQKHSAESVITLQCARLIITAELTPEIPFRTIFSCDAHACMGFYSITVG